MVRTKEEQEEDLAWFKSTFHPIPRPALPDDCVEYCLYIIDAKLDGENAKIVARLREVQNASAALTKELLTGYIWQRDGYSLELSRENGISVLRGRTEFGDSIEDEWVIVYLLRELSRRFRQDLWIRVFDNDGEFLLIEAGAIIPPELDGPELGGNKAWINDGKLKIIDCGSPSKRSDGQELTLQDAKRIILQDPERLLHAKDLEKEAFRRLRKYPDHISQNFHHAPLRIPRTVAHLLHQKPGYISPAVEAFYLRDPIALRPLQAKDARNLTFKPKDFVVVTAKFPKVAYAQLKSQEFDAPPSWHDYLGEDGGNNAAEMGMKLTCGFEMLLADPHNQDKPAVREMKMLLGDIDTGDDTLPSDADVEGWEKREDDESWLNVGFEDLERELGGKPRSGDGGEADTWNDTGAQDNLRNIVSQFQKMLNDEDAGLARDGFGYDTDSDEEPEDEDSDVDDDGEDKNQSFSDAEFARAMREMMGMPPETEADVASGSTADRLKSERRIEEIDASDDDDGENMQDVMKRIEAELNEAGALDLDPTPQKLKAVTGASKGKTKAEPRDKGKTAHRPSKGAKRAKSGWDDDEDSSNDDEVDGDDNVEGLDGEDDIDFNLLKNLLESFKGQAGGSGPAGNLMGMMGVNLPRDEGQRNNGGKK